VALLRILSDYARALDVLDHYNHQRLRVARDTVAPAADTGFELTYASVLLAIDVLRVQFGGSELFGREKDIVRKLGTHQLAKLWRARHVPERGGKSGQPALLRGEKPFVFGW
jgi:hypothetical protein